MSIIIMNMDPADTQVRIENSNFTYTTSRPAQLVCDRLEAVS